MIEYLRDEAQISMDLTPSFGDTLNAKNLKSMGILDEILFEPYSEADKMMLNKRHMPSDTPEEVDAERKKKKKRSSEEDISEKGKNEE